MSAEEGAAPVDMEGEDKGKYLSSSTKFNLKLAFYFLKHQFNVL